MAYDPNYVPTGLNTPRNEYYKKTNHVKISRAASNRTEFLGGGGITPPSFGAYAVTSTATVNLTPALPAHVAGDILLMMIFYDSGLPDYISPAGWTTQLSRKTGSQEYYTQMQVFTKVAGSSETPPNIVFSAAPSSRCTAVVMAIENASGVVAVNGNGYPVIGNPSYSLESVTSDAANQLVVAGTVNRRASDTLVIPNATTQFGSSPGTQATYEVGHYMKATPGPTGTGTITTALSTYRPCSAAIVFSGS